MVPEAIDPLDPITRSLGMKQYELSNHLGNVLVTVSDRKIVGENEGETVTKYRAEVLFPSDYYPFGMQMPGRQYSDEAAYRYGFQGQETDKEWLGGAVSYKYRVHDARIGRFLSVDPLAPDYPWNSPFAFSENVVIHGVDLEGLEFRITTTLNGDVETITVTTDMSIEMGMLKLRTIHNDRNGNPEPSFYQEKNKAIQGPVGVTEIDMGLYTIEGQNSGTIIESFNQKLNDYKFKELGSKVVDQFKGNMSMTLEGQTFTIVGTFEMKLSRQMDQENLFDVSNVTIFASDKDASEVSLLVQFYQNTYQVTPQVITDNSSNLITVKATVEPVYIERSYGSAKPIIIETSTHEESGQTVSGVTETGE